MKSDYLTVALQAVQAAERCILQYYSHGVERHTKEDLSPVTAADQEAEEIIKTTITTHFPTHTFYGEEGEKVALGDQHSGYTWIIDPIDGTRNFLRHIPLFATQLALLKDGELVLGVSNAPLLNELMYAEKGKGCYLNGHQVHATATSNLDDAYISFGGLKYFDTTNTLNGLLALSKQTEWARGIGDFWSYHLLAQGKIDVVIEAGTKLWDIAALKVIVEEAGGQTSQIDGEPISTTSSSIIATNAHLHESILSQLGK